MRKKLKEEPTEWLDPEDEKYYMQGRVQKDVKDSGRSSLLCFSLPCQVLRRMRRNSRSSQRYQTTPGSLNLLGPQPLNLLHDHKQRSSPLPLRLSHRVLHHHRLCPRYPRLLRSRLAHGRSRHPAHHLHLLSRAPNPSHPSPILLERCEL